MQKVFALLTLVTCFVVLPANAQQQEWVTKSNVYSRQVMDMQAQFNPEKASFIGLAEYDGLAMQLGLKIEQRQITASESMIKELKANLAKESDARIQQDIAILIHSLQQSVEGIKLEQKYFLHWANIPQHFFQSISILLSEQAAPERRVKALERLQRYVGLYPGTKPLIEQAKTRFTESRGPDKLGPYRGQIQDELAKYPTYAAGIRSLFEKYGIKDAGTALDAMDKQITDYGQWTKKTVLPLARDDFREPPDVYAYRLQTVGIDLDPETLITRAKVEYYETRSAMQTLAPLVAKKFHIEAVDYRDVIKVLKKSAIPDDKLESTYRDVNAILEDQIRQNHVLTLPDSQLQMRLSTKAEAAAIPAPHMMPPPLVGNTGQQGIFILPVSTSDVASPETTFDDFNFPAAKWTLSAHEARPGHELQFGAMISQGVSKARAIFAFTSVNVEGWALYAEAEMVPYEPVEGQLIAMQYRLLRAARAFIDPMLNLGLMEKPDAEKILSHEVVMSPAMVKQEVDRYTFRLPGQATSYFYGYSRLVSMRIAAELALGNKFNRMSFNDFILSQGLLPPDLLDKAVTEQFIGTRQAHK